MFSIYVTNKSGVEVYIRLQHQKMSAVNPRFCQELSDIKNRRVQGSVISHLLQWGFCTITKDQTMSFTVDVRNEGPRKYVSLYAGSKLWTVDIEMNCLRYGCLLVNRKTDRLFEEYCLNPANPQPVWIPFENGCPQLPENIIKVGSRDRYFGRSAGDGGFPCKVTFTVHSGFQLKAICDTGRRDGGKNTVTRGKLLRDTGHEFVPANTGDPMPPHAVIGGVAVPEGSLYLGRVGGDTPCAITAEGGKIKHFCYNCNKVNSGEILILTNLGQSFSPDTTASSQLLYTL